MLIGPIFLKEDSEVSTFISKMEELSVQADGKLKEEIQKQIKLASYGELGERNIIFELKNSGMDLFVLHDIYLEYDDLSAQIDYMVISRRKIYVIECKNLIGNIEIDNTGSFVRSYDLFGKKIREGIYSPITQNERHLRIVKEIRKESKANIIIKQMFEKSFSDTYRSLVVLANPKTCLNAKFAKKEVKDKVIRADQLVETIRRIDATSKDPIWTEKEMRDVAEFFLSKSQQRKSNYAKKYEEMLQGLKKQKEDNLIQSSKKICPRCGNDLILRTSKKGERIGSQFYGCTNFPKCRYIKDIN